MQEHHRNKTAREKGPTIAVEDVVIVKDDKVKRCFWKLAFMEQLIEGKDGHVQASVIKVGESNSSKKGVILTETSSISTPQRLGPMIQSRSLMRCLKILQNHRKLLLETVKIRNPLALERTGGRT